MKFIQQHVWEMWYFKAPEMSVKIRESYFDAFLDHETGFVLKNGFYERQIPAADLSLSFPDDGESKFDFIYLK